MIIGNSAVYRYTGKRGRLMKNCVRGGGKRLSRSVLIILFMASLAAVPAFSQSDDDWYMGKIVKDITFEGNKNAPVNKLNTVSAAYKGRIFTIDAYYELLGELYALECFETVFATTVRAGQRDSDGVIISFTVTEYPEISKILYTGNDLFSEDTLTSIVKPIWEKTGSPVNSPAIKRQALYAIQDAYNQYGYYDAVVDISEIPEDDKYTVTFAITEGVRTVVEDIRFEGNTVFTTDELRRRLASQSRGIFNSGLIRDSDINEDLVVLGNYYGYKGYMDISINKRPEIKENRRSGNARFITLTYKILQEGKQYIFGGFEFSGNRVFSNAQLSALVQLHPGDVYNHSNKKKTAWLIEDLYYDAGYADFKCQEVRNIDGHVVVYHIQISEGNKMYLENIIVSGNRRISAEAIREKIPLSPGEVFSRKKIMEGIRNIRIMDDILKVRPDISPGSGSNQFKLIVTVEEK
jgi:outer membrane protein insertion porin family